MGELSVGSAARLVAPAIAALNTKEYGGLIPHARQGGNGVRSLAVCQSKLEGTRFENVQIKHIHVALFGGGGSGVGRCSGLSARERGEEVALLEGPFRFDKARFCREDRFEGFGKSVIFGEDLNKPAFLEVRDVAAKDPKGIHRVHIFPPL